MTEMMPDTEPPAGRRRASRAMPSRGAVRTKGVLTIPQEIRRQVDLHEGDEVIFTVEDGRVIVTPASVIPRDQEWFWTPEWQAKEAEADRELAAGEGTFHATDEGFLASLDRP
jgi:AbrB family looped-hinge helix DNA binding protein